ncbi:MAG: PQQ-binding-like beta-propeller repeat protein [Verrucomicrobia bacterium]|nr:PQQ-binding-like beta-propeller repeat protein [Verrucomicrobiota bacterium]
MSSLSNLFGNPVDGPPVLAVVPILVGPLQILLAVLPSVLISVAGALLALRKPATFKSGVKLLWRLKVSVLTLAALVAGAVLLIRAALPDSTGPVGKEDNTGTDWPAFRGGPQRAGTVPGSAAPVSGGLNWAFSAEAKTFYSSPAVVGNRVYVSSAEKGVLTDRGAIYCLDVDTGAVVWKSALDGYRATFSSPAVSGKYLVCGEGLHFTRDGRVVCLDVTQKGALLWQYRTRSHVESSPCIYQGRVCIGAGDDGYYCFELAPDAAGRPKMVWHLPGDKYPDAESSPAAHDGKLFVGLGMEGKAVVCLEAATGAELWRVPTPYPVFAPPTIAGGRLFVGMGNGNFIESAEQVAAKELQKLRQQGRSEAELAQVEKQLRAAGEVWCLDLATHAVAWRFKAGDTILGAVAADRGQLYFGARDGWLRCLSYEGNELGRWNAHAPIVSSPALTETHVYFVTESGRLHALGREGLQPVWETTVGLQGPFLSSPTVAHGRVYVGSQNDGLLCLGSPGGASPKSIWSGFLAGPGRSGNLDASPLPERGTLIWRCLETAGEADERPIAITAPAATVGELLCVPIAEGPQRGLLCLNHESRSRQAPAERWFFETAKGIHLSPAMNGERVFVVDGKPGQAGRRLHCLNLRSGVKQWGVGVDAAASGEFVLLPDCLLIQNTSNGLTQLDLAGTVQWTRPLGALRTTPAWRDDILVVALESPPSLLALDKPTGRVLWTQQAAPRTGPVLDRQVIYLGTANGVTAHRLADGRPLWESPCGQVEQTLAVGPERIACVNADSELVLLEARTGEVIAKLPEAQRRVPPLLTRDAVLYAGREGLMIYEFAQAQPQPWLVSTSLSQISSPMILADSSVFFAAGQRGFIRAGRQP